MASGQQQTLLASLLTPSDGQGAAASAQEFSYLRIASQTKMSNVIAAALAHFADGSKASVPLVLHTVPPESVATADERGKAASTSSQKKLENSVASTSKLVSVVEIIKRSLPPPAVAAASTGEEGVKLGRKRKRIEEKEARGGVHQYTYTGCFEEHGWTTNVSEKEKGKGKETEPMELEGEQQAQPDPADEEIIMRWINGTGKGRKGAQRPLAQHTPFLVIVLARQRLESLRKLKHFNYQEPAMLKKEKAKRLRSRKGEDKDATSAAAGGAEPVAMETEKEARMDE